MLTKLKSKWSKNDEENIQNQNEATEEMEEELAEAEVETEAEVKNEAENRVVKIKSPIVVFDKLVIEGFY